LTRAALRAFGTGTLALTAACGSSSGGTNGPGPDASSLDAGFDAIQAAYGAPAIDSGTVSDAGTAADGDTIPDAPMGIAAYGAPAIDSGGH
jgi:hypothetical protein